jgi:hypothetical protein
MRVCTGIAFDDYFIYFFSFRCSIWANDVAGVSQLTADITENGELIFFLFYNFRKLALRSLSCNTVSVRHRPGPE